jgi:hypothetical protein
MEFLFSIVGHRFTIGLKGIINGSFKLTNEVHNILQSNKNISEIVFVLRKVESIDKDGVKAWDKEIKKLADYGCSLTFIECPKELLEVSSMKSIRSFVIPYYCDSCNAEFPQLINTNSASLSFTAYSKPNCPNCNKRLSLDITEDEVERITSLLPIKDAHSDKRKYPRFDVSVYGLKVVLVRKDDERSISAVTINFSEAGLCVAGREHFEPGDNITVDLTYKGTKVSIDGNVIWFSMEGDSEYMMGLSLWSKDIFNLLIKA